MVDSTKWWQDLPCHYHPSWNLSEISQLDLNKLKHHIDRNENDIMVVERLLYAAFLEVPIGSPYNLSRPSVVTARRYLQEAEEYVENNLGDNRDASIGYGIVINACRMWTSQSTREWEKNLLTLEEQKKEYPKHKHYISAVQAFALSRLGPKWVEEAKRHYEEALKGFPDNVEWLYGKVSMLGRIARLKYPNVNPAEHCLPQEYRKLLEEEKNTLKVVLDLNKDFHIARAMYGQVLSNLGQSEEAKSNIEKARKKAPNNRSIAEIASTYYKKMNDMEQAVLVLENLPDKSKTAQVQFLIGNLYKSKAYNETQCKYRMKMWKAALAYFDRALKLDERHYPAFNSRAEMNAKLGNITEAKEQYTDLLSGNLLDKPYHHKDKFMTLKTLLNLHPKTRKKMLTDEELVNYSFELLNMAVTYYSEEKTDEISFTDFAKTSVEKSIRELENMAKGRGVKPFISSLAKLKLADFRLLCKDYHTAEGLYLDLKDKVSDFNQLDVLWGLAKCYVGKGKHKEAKEKADELSKQKQTLYRVEELYADISLSLAKVELQKPNARIFCEHLDSATADTYDTVTEHESDNFQNKRSVTALLENAIEMGSLEACFIFLFGLAQLQNCFLSKSQEIPRIVAKIDQICSNNLFNVHTDFQVSDYETKSWDKQPYKSTDKKEIIKGKINEILTYPEITESHGVLQENVLKVYDKLAQLRKHLFDFEVVVVRQKNTEWNENCEKEVTKTLCEARFLLDHVISVYQDSLIKGKKSSSEFCVHFDWKEGKVDQKKASEKLQGWLNSKFPTCDLPKAVRDMLLKVQPMYDKENIWLASLHSFVNDVKHAGGTRNVEDSSSPKRDKVGSDDGLYPLGLLKGAKKSFLARKSCQKVEEIVLKILEEIVKLHHNPEQQEQAFEAD